MTQDNQPFDDDIAWLQRYMEATEDEHEWFAERVAIIMSEGWDDPAEARQEVYEQLIERRKCQDDE